MLSLNEVIKHPSRFDSLSNYLGETDFPGWFVVLTENRDSNCLERCNFQEALTRLGGESDSVVIHRFGHWACGWWEALCVLTGTEEFAKGEEIEERLSDYPILNKDIYSEMEQEEANEIWENCFDVKERIQYIREHRKEFEFRTFEDMLGCVRGKYFAGYASELI